MPKLAHALFGKLFADTGSLSATLTKELLTPFGVHLLTPLKRKMKPRLLLWTDKLLLRKRAIVETIFDQLKNISQIEHSRHRSPNNFLVNLLCGLIAYCHPPKKPSLHLPACPTCPLASPELRLDYIQLNKYRGEYQKLQGNPDLSRATTNHCERLNLTVRAFLRRYTRRTLGFSRKLDAHRAATALFVARYNWTHLHRSLRVTPAMEAGLTPSVWSMSDVMREAMETPHDIQPPYPRPGRRPFRHFVGRGSWSPMR